MKVLGKVVYRPKKLNSIIFIITLISIIVNLIALIYYNKHSYDTRVLLITFIAILCLYLYEIFSGKFTMHLLLTTIYIEILDKSTKTFKLIYDKTTLTDRKELIIENAFDVSLVINSFMIRVFDNTHNELVDIILESDKDFVDTVKYLHAGLDLRLSSYK